MSQKYCAGCDQGKHPSEFGINNKRADGLQTYCKECRRVYSKKWYEANAELQKARAKASTRKRKEYVRAKLLEYLSDHCVDCGEADPVVLQFDHLRDKEFHIADMISHCTWARIEAEIRKCEVRCAHCHIRKTAKAQAWYKSEVGAAWLAKLETELPGV